MNKNKRLLIIGSGFSKYVSEQIDITPKMPVTNEIIKIGENLNLLDDSKYGEFKKYYDEIVKKHQKRLEKDGEININLESVYDSIMFSKVTNNKVKVGDQEFDPQVLEIQIIEFIKDVLTTLDKKYHIDDKDKSGSSENRGHLTRYIRALFKEELFKFDNVISFNWDTILDNTLRAIEIFEGNIADIPHNYSLPNAYYFNRAHVAPNIIYHYVKDGKFLKMHGSIGWKMCPCCGNVYVKTDSDDYERDTCHEDLTPLNVLLLAPNSLKDYSMKTFVYLWNEAYQKILEANEIVIFGYSLPENDFKSNDLFYRARLQSNIDDLKLTVYNKYDEKADDDRKDLDSLLERLSKAFILPRKNIDYKSVNSIEVVEETKLAGVK